MSLRLALAAAVSASAVALPAASLSAQTVTPLEAERTVLVDLFLYDSFWRESSRRTVDVPSMELGAFEQDLVEDLSTIYQSCDGRAFQESDIFSGGAVGWLETTASGVDFDDGDADATTRSDFRYAFEVVEPVRIRLEGDAESDLAATIGAASASFRLSGPEGVLLEVAAAGAGDRASGEIETWLFPGAYELVAVSDTFVESTPRADIRDNPATAFGFVRFDFVTTCPADFNVDGVVDDIDADQYRAAWLAGSPAADVNGDGRVDRRDADLFRFAFRRGC